MVAHWGRKSASNDCAGRKTAAHYLPCRGWGRLQRLQLRSEEAGECLAELIAYDRDNACRMRYDEYLRLGYGIGSGAVESAHKQVVHARMRQAGMRWSEAGPRRLSDS